jgi:hypothetical protein
MLTPGTLAHLRSPYCFATLDVGCVDAALGEYGIRKSIFANSFRWNFIREALLRKFWASTQGKVAQFPVEKISAKVALCIDGYFNKLPYCIWARDSMGRLRASGSPQWVASCRPAGADEGLGFQPAWWGWRGY